MSRPPGPVGAPGKITLTELHPGHWIADCRARDGAGVLRRLRRYSPAKSGKDGRTLPDPNGNRAKHALIEAVRDLAPAARDEITLQTTVWDLWLFHRGTLVTAKRAPRTLERYDSAAKVIKIALGSIRIQEVDAPRLSGALEQIAKTHGPSQADTVRKVLVGCWKTAIRECAAIQHNPATATRSPTLPTTGGAWNPPANVVAKFLDDVQFSAVPCPPLRVKSKSGKPPEVTDSTPTVAQFCAHKDMADFYLMLAATGARPSECCGFLRADLDLERRVIRTTGKVTRVTGGGLARVASDTDRKNKTREISLPDFAVTMLTRRLEWLPGDILFPDTGGGYRDPSNTSADLRRVREALGLPENFTAYSFRKFVGTAVTDSGQGTVAAAEVLGNTPSVMERHYLATSRARPAAAEALDAVMVAAKPVLKKFVDS